MCAGAEHSDGKYIRAEFSDGELSSVELLEE